MHVYFVVTYYYQTHYSLKFVAWAVYCSLFRDVLNYTILTAITHFSQQLLVLSGDVEVNPGPKHGGESSDIIIMYVSLCKQQLSIESL